MADTDIIFGQGRRAQVGVVRFDCSLDDTHNLEAVITDHPVEEGIDITDHIKRLPKSIEINGLISNTPIYLEKEDRESPITTDTGSIEDRVEVAYTKLEEIMSVGELITVVTTLAEYDNMVIANFSVTRNAQNGNVLNASLSLREVITTTTEKVEAPEPVKKSKKKTTNKGKKSARDATKEADKKSKSVLFSVFS